MTHLHTRVSSALESRRARGRFRSLTKKSEDGLDFSSNDYLSLSHDALLHEKFCASLDRTYGPSSSRLLDGNTTAHENLEAHLASFFRAPGALLFNSGYDANTSIFATLPTAQDFVLYDELIHASVHAGMRQSRASKNCIPFAHNDAAHLAHILSSLPLQSDTIVFVAFEGLYSMDGDFAAVDEIIATAQQCIPPSQLCLYIDEAHSTGIIGPSGRGLAAQHNVEHLFTLRVHTFGKALACAGAVVLTDPLVKEYFVNYARPLIYSTSMPYAALALVRNALDILDSPHYMPKIAALRALIAQLTRDLLAKGPQWAHAITLPQLSPYSPIIPLLTPRPRDLSRFLASRGFVARPIVYPSVPVSKERVRLCLHAANTAQHCHSLVAAIDDWVQSESSKAKL